jgi:hypothetical protein
MSAESTGERSRHANRAKAIKVLTECVLQHWRKKTEEVGGRIEQERQVMNQAAPCRRHGTEDCTCRPCATCGKKGCDPMEHAGWSPHDEGHG